MLEATDVRQPSGETLHIHRGGSGPALLFLHGFDGFPAASPLFPQLAARHTVIAPEHPGFDDSDDVAGIQDVIDLALLYRRLIEEEARGPVDVVGHSMGALIAAEVAAISPHLVRKLVLANPFGAWSDEMPTPDPFVMTPGELARALWIDPPKPAAPNGNASLAQSPMVRRFKNLGAASRWMWPIPERGLSRRAAYITSPTLVLFGDRDALIPVGYERVFARLIPGAQTAVLEGSHMLPHEQTAAFVERVETFLAG